PGGRALSERAPRVAFHTGAVQTASMRKTVELDNELARDLDRVVGLTKEKPAVVIRQAIRAGLPVVANRYAAPRPEGYFASDYPLPKDRLQLEAAMAKVKQRPDR